MVGRLIADDVHHRSCGTPGVVQIGQAIGQAGPTMKQRRGGLPGHAGVAIGGTGHDTFEQAEHATQAGDAVECGDEVHLRRTGIREARGDTTVQQ